MLVQQTGIKDHFGPRPIPANTVGGQRPGSLCPSLCEGHQAHGISQAVGHAHAQRPPAARECRQLRAYAWKALKYPHVWLEGKWAGRQELVLVEVRCVPYSPAARTVFVGQEAAKSPGVRCVGEVDPRIRGRIVRDQWASEGLWAGELVGICWSGPTQLACKVPVGVEGLAQTVHKTLREQGGIWSSGAGIVEADGAAYGKASGGCIRDGETSGNLAYW